jgi:hypothetical protein
MEVDQEDVEHGSTGVQGDGSLVLAQVPFH